VDAVPGEWSGTAEAYAASFERLCAGTIGPLLDAIEAPDADTLLDVGCGTGALARAAVARGWGVDACDPEPSMIALASSLGRGVRYREAGLPSLPYDDDAFDAVTANFVVNHTTDPRAALAELARVARGTVAVTIWPRRRTALNGLWSGVVRDAGAVSPPGAVLPPELDIDRSEAGLTAALTEAGLRDAVTRTLEWDFAIPADELWAGVAGGAGTIGTTYRANDDGIRNRMRDAYRERARELTGGDGALHLPTFALLGRGSARGA
jgi:SAM-dependent methyltransferase